MFLKALINTPTFVEMSPLRGTGRYTVDDIRSGLLASSLSALAELFLVNGDTHAGLYTGSKAMHTGIMHLLDTGKKKAPGATGVASNLSISVQRRYLNMVRACRPGLGLGLHGASSH